MSLNPLGWRVLVKPVTLEEDASMPEFLKTSKFLIKSGLDVNDERRAKVALEQGVVVSIGPTAFRDASWGWAKAAEEGGAWQMPVKVGDKVWFGKYAGKLIPDPTDGVEYMLLLDEDLQCQIGD
jgi:co-chaperonin GroES (HSP10)